MKSINNNLKIIILALSIFWFLFPALASSGLIYVDSQLPGDCLYGTYSVTQRDCSGSDGDAYNSIKKATFIVQAGDTIYLRQGAYREWDIKFKNSGQPAMPITIAGFPQDNSRPIIQEYANNAGGRSIFVLDTPNSGNFIFKHLVLRNADNGVLFSPSTGKIYDVRIEDCEFYNFSHSGVRAANYGVERAYIKNCKVHNTLSTEGAFDFKVNTLDYSCGAGSKLVIIQDSESYNNLQQQASGLIIQNSCENFIFINNLVYENGEIGIASKAGGYNLFINNIAYNQSKAAYYLRDPYKDFGGGKIIQGCGNSNYLLLNNIGIGRKIISGDQGPIRVWPNVNVWAYGNTLIGMKESDQTAFFGAPFTISAGSNGPALVYAKNNIAYQAYKLYAATFFDGLMNRTYLGNGNLFKVREKGEGNYTFRIHGVKNLTFRQFQDYFNSDRQSIYAEPEFMDFDRTNDSVLHNLQLKPTSPAIDKGLPYSPNEPNDYPGKIEEFLSTYHYFQDFTILSENEKIELIDFIRNAYKYDRNRKLRTDLPDIGAYEFTSCLKGDLNEDGLVNNFDVEPFVKVLTSPQRYPEKHCAADVNADGKVNNFDIEPFMELVGGDTQ